MPIRLLLISIPQYAALSALKMMPYLRHVKGFSYFSVRCDIGELYCSGNSERNLHFAVVFSDPAELRFADHTDELPN